MKSERHEREKKGETTIEQRVFLILTRRMEAPHPGWIWILDSGWRGRDRCTKLLPISMLMERGISSGQWGERAARKRCQEVSWRTLKSELLRLRLTPGP